MSGVLLEGRERAIARKQLAEWARILTLLCEATEPMTCEQLGIRSMPRALSGEFALVESTYDSLWETGEDGWRAASFAQGVLDTWLDELGI
jgi:hypothetical protein